MAHRDYLVALSKVQYYPDLKQWGGYLTPSEAWELEKQGAKIIGWLSNYMAAKRSAGNSRPTWIYFTVDYTPSNWKA